MSGDLFVLSAPSGAGKSTLLRSLFEASPELVERIAFCVSYTTRAPRAGEEHGVHYYFVEEDEFARKIEAGEFLEWADVHGQKKGTCHGEVARLRGLGKDVLLEIDVQGARQVRANIPDSVSIFVLPPSYSALEQRLRGRGTDSEAQIHRRLGDAVREIRGAGDFDYVIVNDDLTRAREALAAVLEAHRYRRQRMLPRLEQVLATLPGSARTDRSG